MGFGMVVGALIWAMVMSVVFMPIITPPLAGVIILAAALLIVAIIRRGLRNGDTV